VNQRTTQSQLSSSSGFSGDESSGPRYAYPPRLVLSIASSVLQGRKRSFSTDAKQLIGVVVPEPRVENPHVIPREGGFVVATNHYCRPGYYAWWGVILVTAAIAGFRPLSGDIVWLITNRWTYPDPLRRRLATPLTHWFLTRIARTYGFVAMPPMPPQPSYTGEGARAVRQVLTLLASRGRHGPIIGIAPEGRDSPDGSLIAPPPGAGRFLIHMASHGLGILPVGVAEVAGTLTARFGPPLVLERWPGLDRREQDRRASRQVMVAIGAQLPPSLWGTYRGQIEPIVGKR